MSFLDRKPRSALVRAKTDAKVAILNSDLMDAMAEQNPVLAFLVLKNLAKVAVRNLWETNTQVKKANQLLKGAIEKAAPNWVLRLSIKLG